MKTRPEPLAGSRPERGREAQAPGPAGGSDARAALRAGSPQAAKMAESSGRAGKSCGSGAGKGAVSAEQVRRGGGGGGRPGRVRRRCEQRARPRLSAASTPARRAPGGRPESGGPWEQTAGPRGRAGGLGALGEPPGSGSRPMRGPGRRTGLAGAGVALPASPRPHTACGCAARGGSRGRGFVGGQVVSLLPDPETKLTVAVTAEPRDARSRTVSCFIQF